MFIGVFNPSCSVQIPRTSKRRVDGEEVNVSSPGSRFRNVLSTVQACGDYDRLQQGVFENYLNIKFKDSRMENVREFFYCFSVDPYIVATFRSKLTLFCLQWSWTHVPLNGLLSTITKKCYLTNKELKIRRI